MWGTRGPTSSGKAKSISSPKITHGWPTGCVKGFSVKRRRATTVGATSSPTRLGSTPKFKLDIFHFEVRSGDRLLLCSDGVTTLLSDEVILHILGEQPPEEAAAKLIESANERGSPDNVTAVVLFAETVEAKPKRYALPERRSRLGQYR